MYLQDSEASNAGKFAAVYFRGRRSVFQDCDTRQECQFKANLSFSSIQVEAVPKQMAKRSAKGGRRKLSFVSDGLVDGVKKRGLKMPSFLFCVLSG